MSEITRDEINARFDEVLRAVHGVYEQLAALNGRTRQAEVMIARLEERTGRVESRSSAVPGGVAGGVAAVLWTLLEMAWSRIRGGGM